jgi:Zn-dependent alcohol dehydrogenase
VTPHDILRKTFGYESFRPGQEGIVSTLLEGRNVLAVMPTGSGKSLCYQVPALARGGLAVVVSPLVALMQDQVAALKLAGVAAETINSASESLHDRLQILTGGEGPEVVVEAIGLPQTFRAAVEEVCFAGRVVYIGYAKAAARTPRRGLRRLCRAHAKSIKST